MKRQQLDLKRVMAVFDLKRIVFWSICFSPTLLMLASLMYFVWEEVVLYPGPCIGRGCAFGEAIAMMAFFSVLVMTWIAHAIGAIVILLVRKDKGRMWLSSVAGVSYLSIRKILISWALAYPLVMGFLTLIALSVMFYRGPDAP